MLAPASIAGDGGNSAWQDASFNVTGRNIQRGSSGESYLVFMVANLAPAWAKLPHKGTLVPHDLGVNLFKVLRCDPDDRTWLVDASPLHIHPASASTPVILSPLSLSHQQVLSVQMWTAEPPKANDEFQGAQTRVLRHLRPLMRVRDVAFKDMSLFELLRSLEMKGFQCRMHDKKERKALKGVAYVSGGEKICYLQLGKTPSRYYLIALLEAETHRKPVLALGKEADFQGNGGCEGGGAQASKVPETCRVPNS